MLVDAHCHLEMIKGIQGMLRECSVNSVKKIVSSSVDLNSMKLNIGLAGKFPEIECCLGIHPSNALSMNQKNLSAALKFLESNLGYAKAVGEIGIDFKHAVTEQQKQKQIKLYKKQLLVAEENSLPAVIHSRFAEKKSLEILSGFNGKVLLHWFDGNMNAIHEAIRRKYFFSAGPAVLFSREYLSKAVLIPLNLLMLETDSPVEFKGKKAMPFWVKRVAQKLSEEKNIPLEEIEQKTTENAEKFFSF